MKNFHTSESHENLYNDVFGQTEHESGLSFNVKKMYIIFLYILRKKNKKNQVEQFILVYYLLCVCVCVYVCVHVCVGVYACRCVCV